MIFEMSSNLRSSAEKLIVEAERDRQRSSEKKRFALGFTPDELGGLYVGDAPLTNDRLSGWTDVNHYKPPVSESAGRAPLQTMKQRWSDFVGEIKESFRTEMLDRADVSNFLEDMFEHDQLKDWVRDSGKSRDQRQVLDMNDMQVIVKEEDQIHFQIDYLHDALKTPILAQSILPIAYVPMPLLDDISADLPTRYVGIMPFLDRFVSLHEIIRQQAGLCPSPPESGDQAFKQVNLLYPQSERECQMVFEAVAKELSIFLAVPPETHPVVHLSEKVMERIHERFSAEHETPILLGKVAHEKMYSEICSTITKIINDEDRSTFIGLGHGDLNATNIMIALNRQKGQSLREDDILVRFIDANPEKRVYDATFELSRLLHWVELGTVLREGRNSAACDEIYSVKFPDCQSPEEFDSVVPQLSLKSSKLTELSNVYRLLLKCLKENVYFLKGSQQNHFQSYGKLSVGIAMYHFVATRYWPRNVERLAAFLTASTELRRLEKPFGHGERCGSDVMRKIRTSILAAR